MTIAIVDTSILCELLAVPGESQQHLAALRMFEDRVRSDEEMLLPLPVLLETGNHIAQATAGDARRRCAETFVSFGRLALAGNSPFRTTPFPSREEVASRLTGFVEDAPRGLGLVDRMLVALWEAQRSLAPRRRVYIGSKDQHLRGFDSVP